MAKLISAHVWRQTWPPYECSVGRGQLLLMTLLLLTATDRSAAFLCLSLISVNVDQLRPSIHKSNATAFIRRPLVLQW